ncbi:hypothetical protein D3C80_1402780 [compost metagenome]
MLARASCHQDLPGLQTAPAGVDPIASSAGLPALHGGPLIDQRAAPRRGFGQTDAEAADVHLHTIALQQATVEVR